MPHDDAVSPYLTSEKRTLLEAVLNGGVAGRPGREMLFEFFEHIEIGVIISVAAENTDESQLQYINPWLLNLIGRSLPEIRSKSRDILLGPDWRLKSDFIDYQNKLRSKKHARCRVDFLHANGSKIPVELSSALLNLKVPMSKSLRITFVTSVDDGPSQ